MYVDALCFSFKENDFLPWKQVSSYVSKSNIQSIVVHKVVIHKSFNSFAVRKSVSLVSRNLMRTAFASKPAMFPVNLWNVKLLLNLFIVSSDSVKSKIACKSVFDVPSKSVKSNVACKPLSNIPNKLVNLEFAARKLSKFLLVNLPVFFLLLLEKL